METVREALAAIPPTEWVAVVLALGYLVLAVRQNAWCWACAAASAGIYLVLFARAGLVMQAALQLFYVGMSVYGWRAWRGGGAARPEPLPVTHWGAQRHALGIAAVLAAAFANGWIIAGPPGGGAVPYVDALVAWTSVLATWLVARKVLENWLYWIAADSIAVWLYWSQGFHATAALFVLYVAIAARGYFSWRRSAATAVVPGPGQAHA